MPSSTCCTSCSKQVPEREEVLMIRWKRLPGGEDPPPIVIEEVADPVELAKAREQDERFKKNWEWFKTQASEVYRLHRGKCVMIAGQELFVGDTPEEASALARAAHPEDNGRFS